jgi:CTD kinase subunit gamma
MDVVMSSPVNTTNPGLGDMPSSQTIPKPGNTPRPPRPDKKQIEQRIEEDRERHKRLRESIWAVPTEPSDAEMWKMWEETSDLGEDDLLLAKEEEEERQRCIRDSCPHRREDAAKEQKGETSGGQP